MHARRDITLHCDFVWTMFGQEIATKGAFKLKKRPLDVEFTKRWSERMQDLWDRNIIRSHPVGCNSRRLGYCGRGY
jgi:hypothetical protein